MTSELLHLTESLAGRYAIERELGRGGMATVYLARDVKHEREVALKVLREDISASIGAGRFLREIKIAAQLQHPHILPLLDSSEAGGRLYFVMPYVKGMSLRERLEREGELPVHETVRLLVEIVDALADAHAHGVVHRDIKPDNVMLSGRHALVTDFGVAKAISEATGRNTITTLGVAVGTPSYMSPEQAVADPHVDHRSDIYSVGVMAYEMLTGKPPFAGASPQQVLFAHVTATPDAVSKHRAAIPAALDQIVARCLAKRPADRFQNAQELLSALEPLTTTSVGVTPAEGSPLATRRAPPKWALISGAALIVAALLLGGVALRRRVASRVAPMPAFERVQLTTSGRASFPVLSPDGKEVVYTERSCAADTLPCKKRLIMQDVGSGAWQPVSDVLDGIKATRWSATGAWILVNVANAGATEPVQSYVMSHLGGARVPMGDAATFTPAGDTVLSIRDAKLRGAKTVTARAYVAPWTQAIDSIVLTAPGRAIFFDELAISPDRRWIAAIWDVAGQTQSILTIHDAKGRVVASRVIGARDPLGTWSGEALLSPIAANGQGGFVRTTVDARTGALGARDTVMLGANSRSPTIGVAAAGLLIFDEEHAGRTSLSTLETGGPTQPYRVGRRVMTDAALSGASITPDGATIVYNVTVAAGNGRRTQFFAMPFARGDARQLTPPLEGVVGTTVSADSRRFTVATADATGGTHLVSYDLASGREVATARRVERVAGVFSASTGPGVRLDHALVYLDSTLAEKRRVMIPDSLGGISSVMSSNVRPAVATTLQPLDNAATFQSDWNFHVPLYVVDTSGRLSRAGEHVSWNYLGSWWLADGSFRFVGTIGTDPKLAFYRFSPSGRAPQRVGIAPFHDVLAVDLAADGRRGVVVTQPQVSDVWLVRNAGAPTRR